MHCSWFLRAVWIFQNVGPHVILFVFLSFPVDSKIFLLQLNPVSLKCVPCRGMSVCTIFQGGAFEAILCAHTVTWDVNIIWCWNSIEKTNLHFENNISRWFWRSYSGVLTMRSCERVQGRGFSVGLCLERGSVGCFVAKGSEMMEIWALKSSGRWI